MKSQLVLPGVNYSWQNTQKRLKSAIMAMKKMRQAVIENVRKALLSMIALLVSKAKSKRKKARSTRRIH